MMTPHQIEGAAYVLAGVFGLLVCAAKWTGR